MLQSSLIVLDTSVIFEIIYDWYNA